MTENHRRCAGKNEKLHNWLRIDRKSESTMSSSPLPFLTSSIGFFSQNSTPTRPFPSVMSSEHTFATPCIIARVDVLIALPFPSGVYIRCIIRYRLPISSCYYRHVECRAITRGWKRAYRRRGNRYSYTHTSAICARLWDLRVSVREREKKR